MKTYVYDHFQYYNLTCLPTQQADTTSHTTAIGASKINYCINWSLLKDTRLHFKTESKAISKIFWSLN